VEARGSEIELFWTGFDSVSVITKTPQKEVNKIFVRCKNIP
jgi:hypothetical protein